MADLFVERLQAAGPRSTVFFSGAGISADAPTCGPLGRQLTDNALDAFFDSDTRVLLNGDPKNGELGYYERLGLEGWYRPRLEVVLDVVFAQYGEDGLRHILDGLVRAEPNANHAFFGRHLLAGGGHATANFDTCIERTDARTAGQVLHFHGALTSASLAELGARMAVIENGLPQRTAVDLDALLFGTPGLVLVFVGYSGSDYFDITPHLISRAPRAAGQTIFWHHFNPSEPDTTLEEAFRAAGADIHRIEGPLSDWLAKLDQAWNLPALQTPSIPAMPPHLGQPPTPQQRTAATFSLYARLGIRTEVIKRSAFATAPEHLDGLADAYWGAGQYRRALDCWIRAYPGSDPEATARCLERQGAVAWIRGQLFKAERLLWGGYTAWVQPGSQVPDVVQVRLVETYLRVTEHMARLPDTRWRVRKSRRQAAEAALERLTRGKPLGIQLTARVSSIQADIKQLPDQLRDLHRQTMQESDALHGMLNFTQGEYRRRVTQPRPGDTAPTPADLVLLVSRNEVLGADGDAARVALLPNAPESMSPAQVWRLFKPVDVTPWHRVRLLAGFTIQWARTRARRPGRR
ncbi:hypothetical protein ACXR8F_21365 [Terrabacter sp. AAH1]